MIHVRQPQALLLAEERDGHAVVVEHGLIRHALKPHLLVCIPQVPRDLGFDSRGRPAGLDEWTANLSPGHGLPGHVQDQQFVQDASKAAVASKRGPKAHLFRSDRDSELRPLQTQPSAVRIELEEQAVLAMELPKQRDLMPLVSAPARHVR